MSLKISLRKRLLDDMIKKTHESSGYMVLVVDPHTSKILSSCCRMYDIMEAGVLVLQNVKLARERLEDLPAVYFIEPNEETISALIKDFSNENKPQYSAAHIFTTGHVKKSLMEQIMAAPGIVNRIKTFTELNVDFLAMESSVFNFARRPTIPNLYFSAQNDDLQKELSITSKKLVSLCLTLNETPYIRYHGAGKGNLNNILAKFVEDELSKTKSKLDSWKPSESRPRGTLLILDRSIDPIAPLMHEFTYQAMVNDLLSVNGELCHKPPEDNDYSGLSRDEKVKKKMENTIVLSEDDTLWTELRHQHIAEVMTGVGKRFQDFKAQNNMVKLQGDFKGNTQNTSVKDMIAAMKDYPKYTAMMKKYSNHMGLAEGCMAVASKKQLLEIGEFEQDMATGKDEDGKKVNIKDLKATLVKYCQDPSVGVLDKLRLLMIYITSQGGIQESTQKTLTASIHARLQNAIRNLQELESDTGKYKDKRKKKKKKNYDGEDELKLMRFTPLIKEVIQDLVNDELSESKFPYVSGTPSDKKKTKGGKGKARSARKNQTRRDWRNKDTKEGEAEDTRPYFIIYILGGMAFSEMRAMYEVMADSKCNIVIGSSSSMVASSYIRELTGLSSRDFKESIKSTKRSVRGDDASVSSDEELSDDSVEDEDALTRENEEKNNFD